MDDRERHRIPRDRIPGARSPGDCSVGRAAPPDAVRFGDGVEAACFPDGGAGMSPSGRLLSPPESFGGVHSSTMDLAAILPQFPMERLRIL